MIGSVSGTHGRDETALSEQIERRNERNEIRNPAYALFRNLPLYMLLYCIENCGSICAGTFDAETIFSMSEFIEKPQICF